MGADADGSAFLIGDWLVEPELNRIVRGEEVVKIDPRNMRLLQLLASRPRQVISQTEIEQTVWSDVVVTSNSVYQSIAQLRRALGDEKRNPRYIETIARKGYRFVAEIKRIPSGIPGAETAQLAPSGASVRATPIVRTRAPNIASVATLVILLIAGFALARDSVPSTSTSTIVRASTYVPTGSDSQFPYANRAVPQSPHARSSMLADLSLAANNDGRPYDSLVYAQKAVELERRLSGDHSPDMADRLAILALAYHWVGDYEAAERAGREAMEILDASPLMHPAKPDALNYLANILIDRGKFSEASAYLERAIALTDRQYGQTSGRGAQSRCNLVTLRNIQSRYSEAERLARHLLRNEAVALSYRSYEVNIRSELAYSLLMQRRYDEARVESERVLEVSSQNLRHDHPYVASAHELLARSLIGLKKYGQAERAVRSAMAIWRGVGGWPWRIGRSASVLGEALLGQGRIAEAEKYLAYASRVLESAPSGQLERLALLDHEARLEKLAAAINKEHPQVDTVLAVLE